MSKKPKKPLPFDPFQRRSRWTFWDPSRRGPHVWDAERGSAWLYPVEWFDSQVANIELDGVRIRRLNNDDVDAIRTAAQRPILPLPGTGSPAAWDDFTGRDYPWMLEIKLPLSDYFSAMASAERVHRQVESALTINSDVATAFLHRTHVVYQPGISGSAEGYLSLAMEPLKFPDGTIVGGPPEERWYRLSQESVADLQVLYSAQGRVSGGSLAVAIRRFNLSRGRDEDEDALIDHWVGLEALFADSKPGDITYKAAMRIAYYIEPEPKERIKLFRAMKRSYSARSDLVHGSAPVEDMKDARRVARDALRRSLRKALLSGDEVDKDDFRIALDDLAAAGGSPLADDL